MPVDSEGNITTTPSVEVKTLHDVIITDKKDVVPLKIGGMARTAQDTGTGIELGGGASYTLPAATAAALGGVKLGAKVTDAAAAPTQAEFNALLKSLRDAGIIAK